MQSNQRGSKQLETKSEIKSESESQLSVEQDEQINPEKLLESYEKALINIHAILNTAINEKNKLIHRAITNAETCDEKPTVDITRKLDDTINEIENQCKSHYLVGQYYFPITIGYCPSELFGFKQTAIMYAFVKMVYEETPAPDENTYQHFRKALTTHILKLKKEVIAEVSGVSTTTEKSNLAAKLKAALIQFELNAAYRQIDSSLLLLKNYSLSVGISESVEMALTKLLDSKEIKHLFANYLKDADIETPFPWPAFLIDNNLELIKSAISSLVKRDNHLPYLHDFKIIPNPNFFLLEPQFNLNQQRDPMLHTEMKSKNTSETVFEKNKKIIDLSLKLKATMDVREKEQKEYLAMKSQLEEQIREMKSQIAQIKERHSDLKHQVQHKSEMAELTRQKTQQTFLEEMFFKAAQEGDIATLHYWLNKGWVNVDVKDSNGNTPVFHAFLNGKSKAADALIDHGADLAVKNNQDQMVIHMACEAKNLGMVKDILKKFPRYDEQATTLFSLLEQKNTPEIHQTIANTILFQAVKQNIVASAEKALSKGADINARDEDEETPLHKACANDDLGMVELLLNKSPNTSLVNSDNEIPIQLTKKENIIKMINAYDKKIIQQNKCAVLIQSTFRMFSAKQVLKELKRIKAKHVQAEQAERATFLDQPRSFRKG